jgi:hypothetical protein
LADPDGHEVDVDSVMPIIATFFGIVIRMY